MYIYIYIHPHNCYIFITLSVFLSISFSLYCYGPFALSLSLYFGMQFSFPISLELCVLFFLGISLCPAPSFHVHGLRLPSSGQVERLSIGQTTFKNIFNLFLHHWFHKGFCWWLTFDNMSASIVFSLVVHDCYHDWFTRVFIGGSL